MCSFALACGQPNWGYGCPLAFSTLSFWDKVSDWTWSSCVSKASCPVGCRYPTYCLCLSSTRMSGMCYRTPSIYVGVEDWSFCLHAHVTSTSLTEPHGFPQDDWTEDTWTEFVSLAGTGRFSIQISLEKRELLVPPCSCSSPRARPSHSHSEEGGEM